MYFVAQSHIIQILIPYLLGFFGIYCRNPLLSLNGTNCSSMQTAEPTKYNDRHKPINLTQISRNAAILSSKRCSVLVALSSKLITDKTGRTIMFSLRAWATLEGVLLQVKSLPQKNIRLLVCAFSCFWMLNVCVFRLSMVTSVSNIVQRVDIIIKIFLYTIFFIFWTT